MEHGTIEREIHVDASPEVVFEVVSSAEHIKEWWSDDAACDPVPGGTGELVFGNRQTGTVAAFTVVDVDPPRLFSFRWCYETGEVPVAGNSLLVTFELVASGPGTTVRVSESGWRELGWEVAVLEDAYQDHSQGWGHFVPLLEGYVARLVAAS
ncbi:MAG: Activator of Hsp90 ATPase 1 family protein [Marmoricola sp.]|nr:Activator of Hsp90 ATPase 1 family protein [Marmoricola sp.]